MLKIVSGNKHMSIEDPSNFSHFHIPNWNVLACLEACLLVFDSYLCSNH